MDRSLQQIRASEAEGQHGDGERDAKDGDILGGQAEVDFLLHDQGRVCCSCDQCPKHKPEGRYHRLLEFPWFRGMKFLEEQGCLISVGLTMGKELFMQGICKNGIF
jgi:hypothetical protein